MIAATILAIFLIPLLFVIIEHLGGRVGRRRAPAGRMDEEPTSPGAP